MPRRLRIEFEGAIYHVMTRGNARQDIVHDDDDRRRLLDDLEHAVTRRGWLLLGFVLMSNHLHLLLQTPRPNLARGMQGFLSSYAHWSLRRRRRPGHLFQGRFKAEMIEDETYYWVVSRYIHLNPVRAGLVAHPAQWPWSSYPGYGASQRGGSPGSRTSHCWRRGVGSSGAPIPRPPIVDSSKPVCHNRPCRRSARRSAAGCLVRIGSSPGCVRWPVRLVPSRPRPRRGIFPARVSRRFVLAWPRTTGLSPRTGCG